MSARFLPPLFPSRFRYLGRWIAVVSLLIPATARAANVHGSVTDPDGRPVPGARVVLSAPLVTTANTMTDENGTYRLDSIAPGRYQLRVLMDGFSSLPVDLVLTENDSLETPVVLQVSAVTESIVVSASQVDLPLSRVADAVTVVTERDLEVRQTESVSDALRAIPGLSVARNGGRGSLTSVFPRGGESDFTLVFIDGIRSNDFGGGFDFSLLPLASVEQIEVVRGPQSALFGSDAIGGVVQIVTRRGGPIRAGATVEGGGLGTFRAAATTAGSKDAWRWGGAFERMASDGFTGTAPATGEQVGNDDYLLRDGSGSLGWQQSGIDLLFNARAFKDERGFPGPYGSNPIGAFTEVDRVSRGVTDGRQFGLRADFPWTGSQRVRQRTQLAYADFDNLFISSFGNSTSDVNRLNARVLTDLLAWKGATATFGFEYQNEQAENTFITGSSGSMVPVRRDVFGYFGELRIEQGERLFVTTGVRLEQITRKRLEANLDQFSPRPPFDVDTVFSANPKVAITYFLRTPTDGGSWTRLRASAGTGIRPPSALEIAFTDNPELRPERSRSVDAGVAHALAAGAVMLEATGFFNRYDDLIVAVGRAQQSASRYRTDNISNARASGLEAALAFRHRSGLSSRVSYTFLSTEILAVDGTSNEAPAPFEPGDALLRRPRNRGSVDVVYANGRVNGFMTIEARGEILDVEPSFGTFGGLFQNPAYAVVHVGAGFRVAAPLEIYGRVMNLFDSEYEETLGFPAIGRTALVGVRLAATR